MARRLVGEADVYGSVVQLHHDFVDHTRFVATSRVDDVVRDADTNAHYDRTVLRGYITPWGKSLADRLGYYAAQGLAVGQGGQTTFEVTVIGPADAELNLTEDDWAVPYAEAHSRGTFATEHTLTFPAGDLPVNTGLVGHIVRCIDAARQQYNTLRAYPHTGAEV